MTTLSTTRLPDALPKVNFTWSPVGAAVTYTLGANTYPPAGTRFEAFYTPVNQVLTFEAIVTPPPNINIIQYRWDLGDGNVKFGQTIGHTYSVPNQNLTCKLQVTDSLNRTVYVSKVLQLQVMFPTAVQDHIRV